MIIRVGRYDKEYYINPTQMITFIIFVSAPFFLFILFFGVPDFGFFQYKEPVNCNNVSDIIQDQSHINYCIYKKYETDSKNMLFNVSLQ
ncbi:MAG: hypothetical protein OEV44_00890 [Spirochaetota bacterium]|nr:hypothetical protein [Spirochaetota bacterium]